MSSGIGREKGTGGGYRWSRARSTDTSTAQRLSLVISAVLLGSACGGDGDGPASPLLPSVAGSYHLEQPRVGGTCAGQIFFLDVTLVVTQNRSDIQILQTEPRPYGPYVGTIERNGSFTATTELFHHTGSLEGLDTIASVEGEFSGPTLTGLETFTVFDVGASPVAREEHGLLPGQSSCTHVIRWQGTRD